MAEFEVVKSADFSRSDTVYNYTSDLFEIRNHRRIIYAFLIIFMHIYIYIEIVYD